MDDQKDEDMAELIDLGAYRSALASIPPAESVERAEPRPLAFSIHRYANSPNDGVEVLEDGAAAGSLTPGERMRCYAEHLQHSVANLMTQAHRDEPTELGWPLGVAVIHQHGIGMKLIRPALENTSLSQIETLARQIERLMMEGKASVR